MFLMKIFLIVFFSLNLVFSSDLNNDCKNMVLIPKNVYYPLFKTDIDTLPYIEVESFYLDKYPVTNSDFKKFLLDNEDWNRENIKSIFADENYLNHWFVTDFEFILDNPVTNVSWFAANEYCNFYKKRLPTLDEWESVGSASDKLPIGKNDPNYLINVLNWYVGEKTNKLINIQDMTMNYWGIYGMIGAVWEWVEDFNSVIMLNADAEGGELEEALYCGAAATTSLDPADYAAFMRFAFRNSLQADYTMSSLGFRCAKNVK